jgi:integrase
MTIYAEKKNGRPTGSWIVEVTVAGRRLRKRASDIASAKTIEADLTTKVEAGEGFAKTDNRERVAPRTLRELLDRGADPIWGRTTIHETASARVSKCAAIIGSKRLSEIVTTDIDTVIETLRAEGLKSTTINQYLSALHRLTSWGAERGWTTGVTSWDWQAKPEQTLRLINDDEETRIVRALESQGDIGREVADFVRVLIATGLRRSELLGRTPADLYVADGATWLRVTNTKTRRARAVPLSDDVASVLRGRLPFKLHAHTVRARWDAARTSLGLDGDGRVVVHALRHTFGTRLIRSGVDAFTTGQLMGHSSLQTTQRYVHVADELKLRAIRKLSQSFSTVTADAGAQDEGQEGQS